MAVTLREIQITSSSTADSGGKEEENVVTDTATKIIGKSARQLYYALKDIRSGKQTALCSQTKRFLGAFNKEDYGSCLGDNEVDLNYIHNASVAVTSGRQRTHQIQYNISKFEVEGHEALVYSLFEGLSGEAYGAVLAQVNIPSLLEMLLKRSPSLNDDAIMSALKEHMDVLHNELLRSQPSGMVNQYMTTALVALYLNEKIYIANIGDSKAYLFKRRTFHDGRFTSQSMSLYSLTEQALVQNPRFDVARALGSRVFSAIPKITCLVKDGKTAIDEENKGATMAFESGDLLIFATKGFASEVDHKLLEVGMIRLLNREVNLKARAAYLARGAYALGSKDPIGTMVAEL